jgi:hypothetical protein
LERERGGREDRGDKERRGEPFFSSRSHIFIVPPTLPAAMTSSGESNATAATELESPVKL